MVGNIVYSYDSWNVSLKALKFLGDGRYLTGRVSWSEKDFDRPDNLFSNTITRADEVFTARAAYGEQLSTFFTRFGIAVPKEVGNIVGQVSGSYTSQNSTINSLDIDNFSAELLFTKRFNF